MPTCSASNPPISGPSIVAIRDIPPNSESALPRTSIGTTVAIYECLEILQRAKLTPANTRAAIRDEKFGDSPAQTADIPKRITPAVIVLRSPSRPTRIPAGTSKIIVPMWRAAITRPTSPIVAAISSLANPGRTGIRMPCPIESKKEGA